MSGHKPLQVLIVDDHEVVRRGLRACLIAFDDMELAGEAGNGLEALQACAQYEPDVILMDIVMPGMNGIEATQQIRKEYPHIAIIALTSFKDQEKVKGMLQAGASGYLLKDAPVDELQYVIRAVSAGQTTFAREVTETLLTSPAPTQTTYDLNEREQTVLKLLVKGMNNREISENINLSQATVKYYVSSLLDKLNVSNRTEAASLAVREGIVKPE